MRVIMPEIRPGLFYLHAIRFVWAKDSGFKARLMVMIAAKIVASALRQIMRAAVATVELNKLSHADQHSVRIYTVFEKKHLGHLGHGVFFGL